MFSQPQLYADAGRNQIYQSWFRSSKLVDKTLCEIGFGSGILSMLALQCLPKHIIAYERNGELYEYAQWCLKKSGLQNRITLYNEHVTPADVTGDVDVIFHELVGDAGIWDEGVYDFVTMPMPVIPSVYSTEFYIIPLDYGQLWDAKRKSLPFHHYGFSQFLSDDLHHSVERRAKDFKMECQVLECHDKEGIAAYVNHMNDLLQNNNFVHTPQQLKKDQFQALMRTSHQVGSVVYNTVSRTVDVSDYASTQRYSMDDFSLEQLEIVVPRSQLHIDYMLIAVARLSHNGQVIKCENYSSWGSVGVWNFISSRQNHPRDLHITFKNKTNLWGNLTPYLNVTQ